MPQDLRTFIADLKEKFPDDYIEVEKEIDPKYQIIGLVEKLERYNRFPVLLCKNVKGHKIPVITNLAASNERLALSIGTDVRHMVEHFARRSEQSFPLKYVDPGKAPVKEVIWKGDDVDLNKLPLTVHNEMDAGPYISAGVALCKDPETGAVNGGIYRHQRQGRDQLGWFVNPANHANYVRVAYEAMNKPMEVAVVIGHHPALQLAGIAKLRGIGGELEAMGGLMGEPLEVVKCETLDLPVPARAEIVVEGKIYPGQRREEGPFGEWPRYYTGTGPRPFIKVTAITMRKDAIFQDTAAAHAEHNIVGALPRMGSLYKRIKEVVPSMVNVNLPLSGGGRVFCYISIKKNVDGEPKQAALMALAVDPSIRHVIMVDDDIDVFNERDVLWALSTRFQADRDLSMIPYALGSHLNPTAYDITRSGKGVMETKLIFDATKPAAPTPFPAQTRVPPDVVESLNLDEFITDGRRTTATQAKR
ncbi:MAG: UbiD family decarboxylase [Acidobacteria bacterium]|nr:UbiD family decarboxylase [Acidobacteriota bacterium]